MNTDIHRFFYFLSLSVCEARVYPCPIFILSFNAVAKRTCPPIFVAEVPLSAIGNNYLLSAKTYQLSA